ncbi:hypothetical protein C0991_004107 [Blastosporella zonata]|nr:hypothetical protein C0991_004107 [Blastosporella zonata]
MSVEIEKINSSKNKAVPHILCELWTLLLFKVVFDKFEAHATKIPGLIFVSGQVPIDSEGVVVPGGIQEHTAQCISNLGNVLDAAGSSWQKVVKVNIYLKDMDNFATMNEVYEKVTLAKF